MFCHFGFFATGDIEVRLYIRWFICQMTTVSKVHGFIAQSVGYANSKTKYMSSDLILVVTGHAGFVFAILR